VAKIAAEVRQEARDVFYRYEQLVVERLLKRPGWRLDRTPLAELLDSGHESEVREFIGDLRLNCAELLDATIAR
jgi:hypothetical protein